MVVGVVSKLLLLVAELLPEYQDLEATINPLKKINKIIENVIFIPIFKINLFIHIKKCN